jgi:hypothetical protein
MHPHLPAATPDPAPPDETDRREPATSMAYLTAALVAVATDVGYDIDTDELPIATGLRCDLVLAWVLAGSQIIVHRYLRSLLNDPIEVMRTSTDRDGVSLHADELADILAFAARLDAKMPALTEAYRTACSHIAHTGLGMAWPITPAPTPTGT